MAVQMLTMDDPAAGEGFSFTVTAGQRWRVLGGSCQLATSATAGHRHPYLVFQNGTTVIWAAGKDGPWQNPEPSRYVDASSTRTLVFYEANADLNEDPYNNIYLPVASKANWLPAGTTITLAVHNIATDDQITDVGLLVETAGSSAEATDSTGVGEIVTFSNPSVGTQFSTTVTTGEAWRIYGGSYHVDAGTGIGGSDNRTPCMVLKSGNTHIYVSSNGNDYTDNADQTVVFNNETVSLNKGTPILTVAGELWDIDPNPLGHIYNPIGVRPIWLPAGTTVQYLINNIQADDQINQVGMLVERQTAADVTDGLGAIQTFSSPGAGAGFTITVPADKVWRIWGGSARIVCSATVASRFPSITYETSDGKPFFFGSQSHASQATHDHYTIYYDAEVWLTDLYVNKYLPVPLRAMWLPEGTNIVCRWTNIQAGDQVSEVGFLIEEKAAPA